MFEVNTKERKGRLILCSKNDKKSPWLTWLTYRQNKKTFPKKYCDQIDNIFHVEMKDIKIEQLCTTPGNFKSRSIQIIAYYFIQVLKLKDFE